MTRKRLHRALKYRSLVLFKSQNSFRKAAVFLIKNPLFQCSVFISIIISSILAGYDRNKGIKVLDLILNAFFILELMAKIVAYGFILHPYSYMRDSLNALDAGIILFGFAASIKSIAAGKSDIDLTTLRLVRIIRPIRLLVIAKELRIVLLTILQCSKALLHVAVFIFFLLVLFAIVGLEVFSGRLHNACYDVANNLLSMPIRVCRKTNETFCGNGFKCMSKWEGPNQGFSSFDNIGYSLFTVFQIITLEDWTPIYYQLSDAIGSKWHAIYFVLLIFLGSYFSLDLLLGVLTNQYMKTKDIVARQHTTNHRNLSLIYRKLRHLLAGVKGIFHRMKDRITCSGKRTEEYNDSELHQTTLVEDAEACHDTSENSLKACCSKIDYWIIKIVHSKAFFWLPLALIALNAGFQVASHKGNSNKAENFLDIISTIFNCMFVIELLLNMRGLGIKQMMQDRFRIFDTIAILLSACDVIYSKAHGRRNSGVSIIRSLSLVRAFQVTKFWPRLSAMYSSFVKSTKSIFSLLVVLIFILFIYALLGHHLFKNLESNSGDEVSSAGSFRNVEESMLMVFILLTGEGWPGTTADIVSKYEPNDKAKKIIPLLYFFSFIVVGNFILLNIFLGIVIDNLTTEQEDTQQENIKEKHHRLFQSCFDSFDVKRTEEHSKPIETEKSKTKVKDIDQSSNLSQDFHSSTEVKIRDASMITENNQRHDQEDKDRCIPQHTSLFIFSTDNRVRKAFYEIVTSIWFPNLCIGSIIISTLLLAFEDPLNKDKNFDAGLRYCDYFFTGVFAVEIIMKIIAFGLILGHPACFLRDKMNVVDMVIVILSLVNIILDARQIDVPLQLRVLRILRVVRGLKISKDLKYVFDCLVSTFAQIFNYFLLYLLLLFIYGVVGVKMYAGKLKKCPENAKFTEGVCRGLNITEGSAVIKDADYNFNNVLNAMVTLFSIGTLDNWMIDLHQLIIQAKDINRSISILFIVSFLLIMTFIMLNVFVGFVVMAFQNEKQRQDGFSVLDKRGQECISLALRIEPESRGSKRTKLQQKIWKYLSSPLFEYCTFVLVILNCVTMMTKHYNQSTIIGTVQEASNIAFTAIFTTELTLKVFAMSAAKFIKDGWCVLDTIVVFGSWLDIIFLSLKIDMYVSMSMFRIFRVIRICRIINKKDNLRQIMTTFFKSLRCVPSIAFLVMMVLFIYAVLGMQLFGKMKLREDGAINRHVNFRDFPTSLMVLLRTTTMDNWRELMVAFADTESFNCADKPNQSCGSTLSYPFFISFVFLSAFMITNLFLAVIMDNFAYLTLDRSLLYCHHIEEFAVVWEEFDPNNTGRIHIYSLTALLKRLPPPLGFGSMCPKRIIYAKMLLMNFTVDEENTVWYRELLFALVVRSLSLTKETDMIIKDVSSLNRNVPSILLNNLLQRNTMDTSQPERQFRIYCASNAIKFYFKIILSILKKQKQIASLRNTIFSHDQTKRHISFEGKSRAISSIRKNIRSHSDTDLQSLKKSRTLHKNERRVAKDKEDEFITTSPSACLTTNCFREKNEYRFDSNINMIATKKVLAISNTIDGRSLRSNSHDCVFRKEP